MLIKQAPDIPSSIITSESAYLNRRQFVKAAGLAGLAASMPMALRADEPVGRNLAYKAVGKAGFTQGFNTKEALTPYADITSYNNFYEFGTSKSDPAKYAPKYLKTDPWSIKVTGLADGIGTYHLEDILKRFSLQERIYRLRCVEAWSMVIPWVGFELAELIKFLKPHAKAKYIAFETLADKAQMPGMRSVSSLIDWPYEEALRLDEAMNPLTLMAVGVYGKEILPQNGAPIRLVVPWKYGFKSIKSIVAIHFLEKQPPTSWSQIAPNEYGFYANVNPSVSHPRWSQATERRLPSGLFDFKRTKTLMFNGYADQVAHLYKGMDLSRFY